MGKSITLFEHTFDVLAEWQPQRNQCQWAMAIIVNTRGHSYRKAGALSLISDSGKQLGLLSGGCLEADIRLTAQKSLHLQRAQIKEYDGRYSDDLAYQIGCGGVVTVLFVPIHKENNFLNLLQVFEKLSLQQMVPYCLNYTMNLGQPINVKANTHGQNGSALSTVFQPKIHLLVAGGGKDAIPVCNFATQLGWNVTVWDPRPSYANPRDFTLSRIVTSSSSQLKEYVEQHKVQFAVLMTHNVMLDSDVLRALAQTSIAHIAVLGPETRFCDVLYEARLDKKDIKPALSGPAGLEIGGDLPSSIALSIVSYFHATAHGKAV